MERSEIKIINSRGVELPEHIRNVVLLYLNKIILNNMIYNKENEISLTQAFIWSHSKEGHEYWQEIDEKGSFD